MAHTHRHSLTDEVVCVCACFVNIQGYITRWDRRARRMVNTCYRNTCAHYSYIMQPMYLYIDAELLTRYWGTEYRTLVVAHFDRPLSKWSCSLETTHTGWCSIEICSCLIDISAPCRQPDHKNIDCLESKLLQCAIFFCCQEKMLRETLHCSRFRSSAIFWLFGKLFLGIFLFSKNKFIPITVIEIRQNFDIGHH